MPRKKKTPTATLEHVHETVEEIASVELTPPHGPRTETPRYAATHHLLVFEKDTPCHVCKVRHSDLQDPTRASDLTINRFSAKDIETHHYPVERSLIDAVDWRKVHMDYPAVYSQESLEMWVDSPENMLVLCDYCHRSPEGGIHHLLTQDFAVRPYLLDGYRVAARTQDAAQVEQVDESIEQKSGIEQAVDAAMCASTPMPITVSTAAPVAAAGSSSPAAAKPTRAQGARKSRTRKTSTKEKASVPA